MTLYSGHRHRFIVLAAFNHDPVNISPSVVILQLCTTLRCSVAVFLLSIGEARDFGERKLISSASSRFYVDGEV